MRFCDNFTDKYPTRKSFAVKVKASKDTLEDKINIFRHSIIMGLQ